MDSISKQRKPKLPRKRKKAAIKVQGRKWYRNTILLFNICNDEDEPVCKFWVNSSVCKEVQVLKGNKVGVIPTATKYW